MTHYSGNDYSNKLINGKPAIWLQYYGWAEAKPAGEFKPGEYMRWNGGDSSKVEKIIKETAKTVTIQESMAGFRGEIGLYERTFKKDRWVALGSAPKCG